MDLAAAYGHLEIIKFLRETLKDENTCAMNFAAKKGHFNVIYHIFKNTSTFFTVIEKRDALQAQ